VKSGYFVKVLLTVFAVLVAVNILFAVLRATDAIDTTNIYILREIIFFVLVTAGGAVFIYQSAKRTLLMEKKEREAVALARTMMEDTPVHIEIWDENRKLIGCNKLALESVGAKDEQEYIARYDEAYPMYQPCGRKSEDVIADISARAFKEGYVRYEWTGRSYDGEDLPHDTIAVRTNFEGNPVIIYYSHDLRQIKTSMAKERRAEEESLAKSTFLARVSHEIRTPLTAILGLSEIQLRKTDVPPQEEEAFVKIHDSAKSLLGIVNDILDLSKIESGKMPLLVKEYETANLIGNLSALHTVYLENKDIQFILNVDDSLPVKLVGDELRIRQVVNNLLSNAFKYTEGGEVSLSFTRETGEEDGQIMLVISVRDTGFGMSQEQLTALSERGEYLRFHEQQLDVTGTGLGISIVYSIVQIMNAQITLNSEIGMGTIVTVRIPQEVASTAIIGPEAATSLQNFETVEWTKNINFEVVPFPHGKVLIVDDVDINLLVAEAMLEVYELQIETCSSGFEAIDKIKDGSEYDIIFMDQMMPEMDGVETTKRIREMGYLRPIVAFTANAVKGQADTLMKSGFNGFISKPLDANRLNAYVTKFVGGAPGAQRIPE